MNGLERERVGKMNSCDNRDKALRRAKIRDD